MDWKNQENESDFQSQGKTLIRADFCKKPVSGNFDIVRNFDFLHFFCSLIVIIE